MLVENSYQEFNRREWLRIGGLGSTGLLLADLLRGQAVADASESRKVPRAKACILCFMFGGQPHQDLYDLKPDAVEEIRGEFEPISTSVPGTQLSELLPRTAGLAHRFAIVRSVTHPDSTHTIAMHSMMTGYRHRRPATNPMNAPDDFPCFGAVIQKFRPNSSPLPSGISLNAPGNEIPLGHIFPGFFAGFLGKSYDPMFITDDPASEQFAPIRGEVEGTQTRLFPRRRLLDQFDAFRSKLEFVEGIHEADLFQRKALSLIGSAESRAAFDLSREPAALRERYGRTSFGQGCLLARRLVEAGVKLVTVNWARNYQPKVADHWDTHADHFRQLRGKLATPFDHGFSTLLEDLHDRGMLQETLVVVMGEFGRTPKINRDAGRDHWPGCNSVLLAGGGIQGGVVLGASDAMAAYPTRDPVGPEDLAATIYDALGMPLRMDLIDHSGRPMPLSAGKPLQSLWA